MEQTKLHPAEWKGRRDECKSSTFLEREVTESSLFFFILKIEIQQCFLELELQSRSRKSAVRESWSQMTMHPSHQLLGVHANRQGK
jgi:hypothetical protein